MSAVAEPPLLPPPEQPEVHRGAQNLLKSLPANVDRDPKTGRLKKKGLDSTPRPPIDPRTDEEPGIPARLAVYRWISEQPKHCDDTDRKRQMRAWAEANPVRFEDKLAALEDEWSAKATKEATAAGSEPVPPAEAPFPEMEQGWAEFQEWLRVRRAK